MVVKKTPPHPPVKRQGVKKTPPSPPVKRQGVKRKPNQSATKLKGTPSKLKKTANQDTGEDQPVDDEETLRSVTKVLISQFRFTYVRKLGEGSEGIVFLADDQIRKRQVAIKTLDLERRHQMKFTHGLLSLGELMYWCHLDHPNLVKLMQKIDFTGNIFFVMEYNSKGTLGDFVNKYRRPSDTSTLLPKFQDEQLMIKWTRELFSAVQYLHWLDFYHLDIKPNNIFIDGDWTLKVGDFGFLRTKYDVCPNVCLGCPYYRPPEVQGLTSLTWKDLDLEKVDIWSCGVTLLEMLSGKVVSGRHFSMDINNVRGNVLLSNIMKNLPRVKKLEVCCPGGKDLVEEILKPQPNLRPTATQILTHPWLRFLREKLELPNY